MMEEDEMAVYLLDKITELAKIRAKAYVEAGADVIYLGDDIGMQHTIMMSEDLYCTWLKPRLTDMISYIKRLNPEVIEFYDFCGFSNPLILHMNDEGSV